MLKSNKELMSDARNVLSGNWGLAIGAFLIYGLLSGASSALPGYGSVIGLIISGPLALGISIFSLNLVLKKKIDIGQIFQGFNNFVEALVAYLLMVLYVMLWSLLLIVPGIIAAISYSQIFYIMADNDKTKGVEALKQSKEMMKGNKWKYFCLGWRFLGWFFLSILTLGVGFLWFVPYVQVTYAEFYQDLKKNSSKK